MEYIRKIITGFYNNIDSITKNLTNRRDCKQDIMNTNTLSSDNVCTLIKQQANENEANCPNNFESNSTQSIDKRVIVEFDSSLDTANLDLIELDDDSLQKLQEFENILNNTKSALSLSENDLNLEDINDVICKQMNDNADLALDMNDEIQNNAMKIVCLDTTDDNIINERPNNAMSIVCLDTVEETMEDIDVISINSQDSTCTGYNSSDFEFISEEEAKKGCVLNGNFSKIELDPGEGTSKSNGKRFIADKSYRNNHSIPQGDEYLGLFQGLLDPWVQQIHFLEYKSTRVAAMNARYDGVVFDQQLAGRGYERNISDEEFEEEAKENAKRILSMYPYENRKRRRRH